MGTIAYRLVGEDLVLFLVGDAAPTQTEWQDYSRFISGLVPKLRANHGRLRFLTFAHEGGPNAKQRAAIVESLRDLRTQTAVISNSLIVRHVITAHAATSGRRILGPFARTTQRSVQCGLHHGAESRRSALPHALRQRTRGRLVMLALHQLPRCERWPIRL
jgi:hypothetical protein